MACVTISVDKSFKERLAEFPWINWSEVAKEETLKNEERAALFEELDELTKNSTLTDADCERLGRLVKKKIRLRLERGD